MKPTAPAIPFELEQELFAAALAFRGTEPWRAVQGSQYLLVAEPAGGRRALVVVGSGGEQYGLQSYGSSCAARFLVLAEDLAHMERVSPTSLYELLEGVEVEFTGRSDLTKPDLARAESSGHRPAARAPQAWPQFRAWRPNRYPWHIAEHHARDLLGDLRRARRWVELAPTLRQSDLGEKLALRRLPVVAESLATDRPWTPADLTWERLVMPPAPAVPVLPVEFARLAAWRALPIDPKFQVVLDERAPMIHVEDNAGGAPYFPHMGLCLDRQNGMILGHTVGAAEAAFGFNALGALESAIRARGHRPCVAHFANPNLALALGAMLPGAEIATAPGLVGLQALNEIWSMMT